MTTTEPKKGRRVRMIMSLVAAAVLVSLTGCGGSGTAGSADTTKPTAGRSAPAAAGGATASPSATASAAPRMISVTIKDRTIRPAFHREKIKRGEQVTLTVTTDAHDELHIHGADLEKELVPGQRNTVTFSIDASGVFVVEAHHSGLELLQFEVR